MYLTEAPFALVGRGLWLVRQRSDYVQFRTERGQAVVRMYFSFE
jgi:hypothetical protein